MFPQVSQRHYYTMQEQQRLQNPLSTSVHKLITFRASIGLSRSRQKITAMKTASIIFVVVFQEIVKSHSSLGQSAKWQFQFNFTGYGRQNQDFLMKNCSTNIKDNVAQTGTKSKQTINQNMFTSLITQNGAFIAKNLTSTSRLTGNYSKMFKSGRKNKAKCPSV